MQSRSDDEDGGVFLKFAWKQKIAFSSQLWNNYIAKSLGTSAFTFMRTLMTSHS